MTKEELIGFEENIKRLWEEGKVKCPVHLSGGNEEELIEIFKEIKRNDYVFSTHRNHYHFLLHGGSPDRLTREILKEEGGLCRGRSGSMCTMDHHRNFYSSAIVGGVCGIAVGVAWGLKEAGRTEKVWCFVGDGAVDGGHFWESLQYAQGWDLPIKFIVENNDRSTCTTCKERLGDGSMGVLTTKVKVYCYKPTYPHVGSGIYVAF